MKVQLNNIVSIIDTLIDQTYKGLINEKEILGSIMIDNDDTMECIKSVTPVVVNFIVQDDILGHTFRIPSLLMTEISTDKGVLYELIFTSLDDMTNSIVPDLLYNKDLVVDALKDRINRSVVGRYENTLYKAGKP